MDITPEMREKMDRIRAQIERTQLVFEQSIPAEVRLKLNQHYDRFRKKLSDSEILKMAIMADVLKPRPPMHWGEYSHMEKSDD